MNILHTVEFFWPSVGGAQEVIYQVSKGLVQQGHQVTVATTRLPNRKASHIDGISIAEFAIHGNAVRGIQGNIDEYQTFLCSEKFDLVLNYAAQQWTTDLTIPVLSKIPAKTVLVPCGFSGLYLPIYQKYFEAMPSVLRSYDHLVFHARSYRDIDFARQNALAHYSIIPNGASSEEFSQPRADFRERFHIPESVPLIITVGSHTGFKGHRLAIDAFERIRTSPAVLVIIGNWAGRHGCFGDCLMRVSRFNFLRKDGKRILLLNPHRPDVVAAYHAADLFIFGSNIEYSPLVLFEAVASNTPFLSLNCGNATEIADWTDGGIIVPSQKTPDGYTTCNPEDFARMIETLVSDSHLRGQLGTAGRKAWKESFTWEKISAQYEKLYYDLLA